jgi:hypothetical protein
VATAAAVDALVTGAWALLLPGDLLDLLAMPATPDRLWMWRAIGSLTASQAGFLAAAAVRPGRWANAALVAISGRALSVGVWVWLAASGKAEAATSALWILATHEALWLPLLAAFLWAATRTRRKSSSAP